jgi:transposase
MKLETATKGLQEVEVPRCGLEANRDTVAVMNIERVALIQVGGSLTTPTAPQMTDVAPNRCGKPMNSLKGALAF